MSHLGVGCSEKLAPGGQFVEDVSDLDCRAVISAARGDGPFAAAVNLNAARTGRILRPARGPDLRNRSNTCQRLAAKAERRYGLQIGAGSDLAGRVGLKRAGQILAIHPPAVVGNRYQLPASIFDQDRDFRRPGVDTVLHQLLNHAGGSLDYLSGGNHVNHILVKSGYLAHCIAIYRSQRIN